jgi:hypothetical protein
MLAMNKKYNLHNVVRFVSSLNSILCPSMAVVKEMKYVDERRAVKSRCTEEYFFSCCKGSAISIVCNIYIYIYYIKRH